MKIGQIGYLETSLRNYHNTLNNVSEERRFRRLRGGILKSQFHFFKVPTLTLGHAQPQIQWVRNVISAGIKRLELETGQSHSISAERMSGTMSDLPHISLWGAAEQTFRASICVGQLARVIH